MAGRNVRAITKRRLLRPTFVCRLLRQIRHGGLMRGVSAGGEPHGSTLLGCATCRRRQTSRLAYPFASRQVRYRNIDPPCNVRFIIDHRVPMIQLM